MQTSVTRSAAQQKNCSSRLKQTLRLKKKLKVLRQTLLKLKLKLKQTKPKTEQSARLRRAKLFDLA